MGELYDRIAAFDRGIADRWKARTKEKADYKLRAWDIDAIIAPMMRGRKKITEKQANAIAEFVKGTKRDLKDVDPIRARLTYYVRLAEEFGGIELEPLVGEAALAPVFEALSGPAILKIAFKSPKTGVYYMPIDYLSVRKLVEAGKVTCAEARVGGLSMLTQAQGEYHSGHNILVVYAGLSQTDRAMTIVHEVTHLIQDFRDARGMVTHFEADAFIAGAMVEHVLLGRQEAGGAIYDAAFKAAKFVVDRKVGPGDKDWLAAYDAVVAAVNASDTYKAKARLRVDKGKGETESEPAALADAIGKRVKDAQDFANWAKDALDETLIAPLRRIKDVIP
jgi:hypothetical protein